MSKNGVEMKDVANKPLAHYCGALKKKINFNYTNYLRFYQ